MTLVKIPTNEEIKAGFTYLAFSKIIGERTYKPIKTLKTQAICNAVTVECCIPSHTQTFVSH